MERLFICVVFCWWSMLLQGRSGLGQAVETNLQVVENSPTDYLVGTVQFTSASNYRFETSGEDCATYFTLDPDSGDIRVINGTNLDREEIIPTREALLCFIRYDFQSNAVRTAPVNIEILDLNDCTPYFFGLQQPHNRQVSENVAVPTPIETLQPIDRDKEENGTTRFTITSGNEASFFSIKVAEGDTEDSTPNRVLWLDKEINFENLTSNGIFNLTITISDLGAEPRMLQQRINIQVTNMEDEPPTFDRTSYNFNVTENRIGDFGRVRAASDQSGGGNVFYYICSSCAATRSSPNVTYFFGVSTIAGVLFVRNFIDFEILQPPQRFRFEVQASNPNTRHVQTTVVTVDVIDVNEHPPFFKCAAIGDKFVNASYSCGMNENVNNSELYIPENYHPTSSTIFRFHIDDDDQKTEFKVINTSSTAFRITPEDNPFTVSYINNLQFRINTVVMEIVGELDREQTPNFTLTLMAENLAHPTLRSETTIIIWVLDMNDNAPAFTQGHHTRVVMQISTRFQISFVSPPSCVGIPEPPTNMALTVINRTSILVTWDAPNSEVTVYVVTWEAVSGSSAFEGTQSGTVNGSIYSETRYLITNLHRLTTYRVVVHGENSNGVGMDSGPATVTTTATGTQCEVCSSCPTLCEICPSCSTSTALASVITAIASALLATVIFVLVQIAVCKCHPKFAPGGADTGTSAGGEGQEYEEVDGGGGGVAVSDPTYMEVGDGGGQGRGNTFQLKENDAYGDIEGENKASRAFQLIENEAYVETSPFQLNENEAYGEI